MARKMLSALLVGLLLGLVSAEEPTVEAKNATKTSETVATEEVEPVTHQLIFDKLNQTIKQEIRDIIGTLDKKYQERKGASLLNFTRPAAGKGEVEVGSRFGIPVPVPVIAADEQFQYYAQPLAPEYPVEPAPLFAYNFGPRHDIRRGSFSIFDRLSPELPGGLPVRQVLEGPINIAIPMINHEILVYFVNRGMKSVKFTPSLRPLSEALTRDIRKVGLTLPAAFSLHSRYLSWPVKNVVFADPVFLADITNTATYPTVLFIPEDDVELRRLTPDIFLIGDFSLLDEGIRYVLPTQKRLI